jgi:ABC-type lipoprotein export system ATPase subunit
MTDFLEERRREIAAGPAVGGVLSLRGVCLGFRRGERYVVQALRDVSLDVDVGEVVSVLARRAQGKTTLLRVAAGVRRPGAGMVYFESRDLWELSDSERSGLLARRVALVRPVTPEAAGSSPVAPVEKKPW